MRALQRVLTASLLFCLATAAAEAGLLIALWQRGSLTSETAKNLLMVAYDVPVRDIEERLLAGREHKELRDFLA